MGRLKQSGGLSVVTGPDWPGVHYFCTTRVGGVSHGPWSSLNMGLHTGDDPALVLQNRRRIPASGQAIFWLNQVHGTDVCDVESLDEMDDAIFNDATTPGAVQADALVSAKPGRVLAIMTADCLPVVISSLDSQVVGIAHAGWRGLAAGILEQTLAALQSKYRGPTSQWRAWLGPAIGACCFEVGNDVRDVFVGQDPRAAHFFKSGSIHGKWLADLPGIARHRLSDEGVKQIHGGGLCTYCRPDLFYSYRRDGATGRMATVAWLHD